MNHPDSNRWVAGLFISKHFIWITLTHYESNCSKTQWNEIESSWLAIFFLISHWFCSYDAERVQHWHSPFWVRLLYIYINCFDKIWYLVHFDGVLILWICECMVVNRHFRFTFCFRWKNCIIMIPTIWFYSIQFSNTSHSDLTSTKKNNWYCLHDLRIL